MDFLYQIMPSDMYDITKETILDLISIKRGGLLSFGVLAALFLSTNGFNTLIKTFNSCHKVVENRGFFETRITAQAEAKTMKVNLFEINFSDIT